MKTLNELVNLEDSGWELIKEWVLESKNDFEILPRDE
ncbi:DUF2625 family protein [Campylobacter curvus]|nr:DUF2625 family protein [Campylobacter curvus]